MNKEEIQHKLEQARMDRDLAVIQANKEIDRLEAQLTEPEKPKLRHGDFGLNENGKERIVFFQNGTSVNSGRRDDYACVGMISDSEITVFFNIFDLTKDWGKKFERFDIPKSKGGGGEIALIISGRRIEFWVGGKICTLIESEAYEIWLKLGHALAELKKKKSQE